MNINSFECGRCKKAFVLNLQNKSGTVFEHRTEETAETLFLRPNSEIRYSDLSALDFLIDSFPDPSICIDKLLDICGRRGLTERREIDRFRRRKRKRRLSEDE